jgi:E-phenylitaconyl-CoA hydratase
MSVDIDIAERVAVVTLNRPEKLNAIDLPMRAELQDAWRTVSADAGDRAFSVGSDLAATPAPEGGPASQAFGHGGPDHLLDGLTAEIPVIAAIGGYAIGGGLEIALACDIRIASDDSTFALSEVQVGSMPGAGGTQRLPRIVGPSLAMQMMLTGERIGAERALAAGLVSELMPRERLRERALELAARIARNAPLAVRATKRLAGLAGDVPLVDGLRIERLAFEAIRASEDRAEGRAAFAEKRDPVYRGR